MGHFGTKVGEPDQATHRQSLASSFLRMPLEITVGNPLAPLCSHSQARLWPEQKVGLCGRGANVSYALSRVALASLKAPGLASRALLLRQGMRVHCNVLGSSIHPRDLGSWSLFLQVV